MIPAKIEFGEEIDPDKEVGEKKFVRVGRVEDFVRKGAIVLHFSEERQIALFKIGDNFRAISHICPHQHAPVLGEGLLEDETITCPLHGWMYCLKTGKALGGTAALATYTVIVEEGTIYVEIPEEREPAWMRNF